MVRTRSRGRQRMLVIVVLGMLVWELLLQKYLYFLITALVLLACFLRKQHVISEKGVNIQYHLLGQEINTLWPWDRVTGILVDYAQVAPHVRVYLRKGLTTRAFQFDKHIQESLVLFLQKQSEEWGIELTIQR